MLEVTRSSGQGWMLGGGGGGEARAGDWRPMALICRSQRTENWSWAGVNTGDQGGGLGLDSEKLYSAGHGGKHPNTLQTSKQNTFIIPIQLYTHYIRTQAHKKDFFQIIHDMIYFNSPQSICNCNGVDFCVCFILHVLELFLGLVNFEPGQAGSAGGWVAVGGAWLACGGHCERHIIIKYR